MQMKHFWVTGIGLALGLFCIPTPTLASSTSTAPLKEIALTFDDGPYGTPTSQILSILESEHVPATFFLIGKNVEKYPGLVRREMRDGDLIGNHTYDHAINLASSTASVFEADLTMGERAIASATGLHTTFFRPPYGNMSSTMQEVLRKKGYKTVMWTVDTEDWDYAHSSTASIVSGVLSQVKAGSIIILHDGRDSHVGYPRSNTVNAVPIIIGRLKKQGYTFVTVNKLLL